MNSKTEQQREAERWTAEARAQATIAQSLAVQANVRAHKGDATDQLAEMAALADELAYEAHIRVEELTADPGGSVIWAPVLREHAYEASARAHKASESAAYSTLEADVRANERERTDDACGHLLPAGIEMLTTMLDEEQTHRPIEEWRRRYAASERYDMLNAAREFTQEDLSMSFSQLVIELGLENTPTAVRDWTYRGHQVELDEHAQRTAKSASDATEIAELASLAAAAFLRATQLDTPQAWAEAQDAMRLSGAAQTAGEQEDSPACPSCGSEEVYCTSYCNYVHCVACGAAVDEEHEECWVPPIALAYEMAGDYQSAIVTLRDRTGKPRLGWLPKGETRRDQPLDLVGDVISRHPDL